MPLLLVMIQRLPKLNSLRIDNKSKIVSIDLNTILKMFTQNNSLTEFIVHARNVEKNLVFDLDFHRQFMRIVGHREGVKFVLDLKEKYETIVMTKDHLNKNGIPLRNVHILDLPEKCLQHIMSYLDFNSHRALYDTCKRLCNEVGPHISNYIFRRDFSNKISDNFLRFEDKIIKLEIRDSMVYTGRSTRRKFDVHSSWNQLIQKFGKNLIELHIVEHNAEYMNGLMLSFPNLLTLKIKKIRNSYTKFFSMFHCPKLMHLEIESELYTNDHIRDLRTTLFDHLRIIKVSQIDDVLAKLLNAMNPEACSQVTEFTIGTYEGLMKMIAVDEVDEVKRMRLINIISRFSNLTVLNVLVDRIERGNFQYLFENCTKLVKLSIFYDNMHTNGDYGIPMLKCLKNNCKQLKVLNLLKLPNYGFSHSSNDPLMKIVRDIFPKDVNIVYDDIGNVDLNVDFQNYIGDDDDDIVYNVGKYIFNNRYYFH